MRSHPSTKRTHRNSSRTGRSSYSGRKSTGPKSHPQVPYQEAFDDELSDYPPDHLSLATSTLQGSVQAVPMNKQSYRSSSLRQRDTWSADVTTGQSISDINVCRSSYGLFYTSYLRAAN